MKVLLTVSGMVIVAAVIIIIINPEDVFFLEHRGL